jgi:preprotein translocase SecE subunit
VKGNFYIQLLIWVVVVTVIFGVLWRTGQLLRLANYVQETKEELKKCTWPGRDELKGSTFVVMLTILALGVFTMIVDGILLLFVRGIQSGF